MLIYIAMSKILLKWLINALALLVTTYVVKGIEVTGGPALFLAAALLGILNALIRPILLVLTLPINIITLGLFTLVINGAMLWLVSLIIKGFVIQGFWAAIIGALIISLISWVFNWLIH
jgi:putative membrane protein